MKGLYDSMDAAVKGSGLSPPTTLGQYCTWLAEFDANKFDDQLELPGEYRNH